MGAGFGFYKGLVVIVRGGCALIRGSRLLLCSLVKSSMVSDLKKGLSCFVIVDVKVKFLIL